MADNIILLPCNNKMAIEQFEHTVIEGISPEFILEYLDKEDASLLRKNQNNNISIWGMTGYNQFGTMIWNYLKDGDHAIFYRKDKLILHAKLYLKRKNSKLSQKIWGNNQIGGTWELLLFLESCENIDIKYNDLIIDNIPMKTTPIFLKGKEDRTEKLLDLVGAEDDEGNIRISSIQEDIANSFIDSKLDQLGSSVDTDEITRMALDKISAEEPEVQIIKKRRIYATLMSRNKRIAKYVKNRANYRCEICGQPGFKQINGELYAEAHHWDEVAKYQTDDPGRMCCVCPTCHRVIHFGTTEELETRKKINNSKSS